jgi:hypothetical protein
MYTESVTVHLVVPQKKIWEPFSKGFVVAFSVLQWDSFVSGFTLILTVNNTSNYNGVNVIHTKQH